VVFNKEVKDNLRDRRSVLSALLSTLIGPAVLLVLIIIIGRTFLRDEIENLLPLPVSGVQHAPSLVQFLEENGVQIEEPPDDPEGEVLSGGLDAVLIIPKGYEQDFTAGRPATVRLIQDSSRQSAMPTVERVRRLLSAYSYQVATLRLLARGVSPAVIQTLAIEDYDLATPQSQGLAFLNMMPYFIVMVVFMGGMYVIIDTTAGERERGSLEPLLINPVPRRELVIGKLAASIPFTILALLITLFAFYAIYNIFPIEEYLGLPVVLEPRVLAGIFMIALPMVLLASALQMIIATFTHSFKEAQTYVAFLPLVPALPGIALAFLPIQPSLVTMLIPTFGQQLLINQLMRGETLNPFYVAVSAGVTLLLAVLLILAAIRMYERERILLGGR
jgi:sodium transport system permease protein